MTEAPRTKMRRLRWIAAACLGLVVAFASYVFFVEPYWIEVTHHRVPAPVKRRFRIAHLTDLHTKGIGAVERKMLDLLAEEKPDLILITGDAVHTKGDRAGVEEVFRELSAPRRVWFAPGNWEHWRFPDAWPNYYPGAPEVRGMMNEAVKIEDGLWIASVDDYCAGRPHVAKAFENVPDNAFVVSFFHSPEIFDVLAPFTDIALAGHSHGGQVRLPFVGAQWFPYGTGRYEMGWYEELGAKLYVSRGIGMTILPLRFNCRPEIAIIDLVPQ